ncbi:hypothetical protein RRF57_004280 [Xylaria bambusicola]|uniref:Uncharacterized protein n=1 Tax=Xylaria bambusicola TaxID=326684 RepID=A0AAN7YWY5_9PEZI
MGTADIEPNRLASPQARLTDTPWRRSVSGFYTFLGSQECAKMEPGGRPDDGGIPSPEKARIPICTVGGVVWYETGLPTISHLHRGVRVGHGDMYMEASPQSARASGTHYRRWAVLRQSRHASSETRIKTSTRSAHDRTALDRTAPHRTVPHHSAAIILNESLILCCSVLSSTR